MWLVEQSHQGDRRSLRFHPGGMAKLRIANLEFVSDAKRNKLSILTVFPDSIANGLDLLHGPEIEP